MNKICIKKLPVNNVVSLKVVIVLSKRINQWLSNFHPAKIEEKLEDGEDGDVHVMDTRQIVSAR